jgi:hypothetical protein
MWSASPPRDTLVGAVAAEMPSTRVGPSGIEGQGVFAARSFAAGETILRIDDSRTVDHEHPLRPERGEEPRHCDYLAGGRVVLLGEPERHINSSCDPSAFVRWDGETRFVVARRPLRPGDEITYDYIIDCHGGAVWTCRCGAVRCRGTIVSNFFDLPLAWQEEYLPLLSPWFVREHAAAVAALRARLG